MTCYPWYKNRFTLNHDQTGHLIFFSRYGKKARKRKQNHNESMICWRCSTIHAEIQFRSPLTFGYTGWATCVHYNCCIFRQWGFHWCFICMKKLKTLQFCKTMHNLSSLFSISSGWWDRRIMKFVRFDDRNIVYP